MRWHGFAPPDSSHDTGQATSSCNAPVHCTVSIMARRKPRRVGLAFAAWVTTAARGGPWVLLGAAVLTLLAALYVGSALRIQTDTEEMLSPDLAFRQQARLLDQAFPQTSDNLIVVIEGATSELADQAAERLIDGMRKQPELFGEIFDPRAEPFYQTNGLLYLSLPELRDLADKLAGAQPFLGTLAEDPSLRGLFDLLELSFQNVASGQSLPVPLRDAMNAITRVAEATAAGGDAFLSLSALMNDSPETPSEGRRIIMIKPVLDYGSLRPAGAVVEALRRLFVELGFGPEAGVQMKLTGSAALANDELRSVQSGLGIAGILSVLLVSALLFWALGSVYLVVAAIITLAIGLVWTAALGLALVGTFNLISVAFAILFVGLSVDFGLHFLLRYRETEDASGDRISRLATAAEGSGGALLLSAVAAAIGFIAFLPTDYRGLAELGLIAAIGMFVALIANLSILPAMVAIGPYRLRMLAVAWPAAALTQPRPTQRRPAVTVTVAAIVSVLAAAAVPFARFDFDPLSLQDPEAESVRTLRTLIADGDIDLYAITVLEPTLAQAGQMAARIAQLPEVAKAETLFDLVPVDQDAKLAVIDDMAFYLAPALSSARRPAPSADERADATRRFIGRLSNLEQSDMPAARLAAALETLLARGGEALAEFERRAMGSAATRVSQLEHALRAQAVGLDDLPRPVSARMVAADGRARITVTPSNPVGTDQDALRRFVDAVSAIAPNATGAPIIITQASRAVVASFVEAGLIAVGAIALMLLALLRSARTVLLIFAPLFLAALLTVAFTVVVGQPFNFANVVVLPLLFGLGVANGIHFVSRARQQGGQAEIGGTSTPRAVVFSGLTTIASFGSIALSSHPGTASMGLLLAVAIGLTLASTLLVLPALLTLFLPSRPPSGSGRDQV
jgi:hopanoid biosynthesis associated RND transporter like protein HpnN